MEMRCESERCICEIDHRGMMRTTRSRTIVRHSLVKKKLYSWMHVDLIDRSQKPLTGLQLKRPTRISKSVSTEHTKGGLRATKRRV